jgi:hypothetical protein
MGDLRGMRDDNGAAGGKPARERRCEGASALPLQLGRKLREVFADGPATAAMPDRLQELLVELAAKDREPR